MILKSSPGHHNESEVGGFVDSGGLMCTCKSLYRLRNDNLINWGISSGLLMTGGKLNAAQFREHMSFTKELWCWASRIGSERKAARGPINGATWRITREVPQTAEVTYQRAPDELLAV